MKLKQRAQAFGKDAASMKKAAFNKAAGKSVVKTDFITQRGKNGEIKVSLGPL